MLHIGIYDLITKKKKRGQIITKYIWDQEIIHWIISQWSIKLSFIGKFIGRLFIVGCYFVFCFPFPYEKCINFHFNKLSKSYYIYFDKLLVEIGNCTEVLRNK